MPRVIVWGGQWPAQPKPNIHPAPGPVIVRRATRYTLRAPPTAATGAGSPSWRGPAGTTDALHFPAVHARFVRIRIAAGAGRQAAAAAGALGHRLTPPAFPTSVLGGS